MYVSQVLKYLHSKGLKINEIKNHEIKGLLRNYRFPLHIGKSVVIKLTWREDGRSDFAIIHHEW